MAIEERLQRRITALHSGFRGVFSRDISDMAEKAYVIIPSFSSSLEWGPCRWQSRDATSHPSRGDLCLVLFDEAKQPWVAAWWPFDV